MGVILFDTHIYNQEVVFYIMAETNRKKRKKQPKDKTLVRHQSIEENESRDKLNDYLKNEIFRYGDDKNLPRLLWVRINALRVGKKYQKQGMNNVHIYYDFNTILETFKYCKSEILKCINTTQFNNEVHQINTVMLIVERNINTVVDNQKKQKIIDEKLINRDMSIFENNISTTYTPKSEENTNPELEGLW